MKKIIILAGSYRQFFEYCEAFKFHGSLVVYGNNPEKILGIQAEHVIVIGTFWELPEAKKLYDLAMSRIF